MLAPTPERFFCVCTEAIEQTHRALQQLEASRRGSGRPSRALRVAQLYGHLQLRARSGQPIQLSVKHLADRWHLQPRELRADLNDLQALGWLRFSTDIHGTMIELSPAVAQQDAQQPASGAAAEPPEPSGGSFDGWSGWS